MASEHVSEPLCTRESTMSREIHRYLADDHRRLEGLLDRATSDPQLIDGTAYAQFRAGLLKHIGMEEKVLFPSAQKQRGGAPLPAAARLRLDHGALVALLVPSPTPAIVAALRAILDTHDPVEEDPGGVYDQCEELAGEKVPEIIRRLKEFPDVRALPHVDTPFVMDATRRALARAGYSFEL